MFSLFKKSAEQDLTDSKQKKESKLDLSETMFKDNIGKLLLGIYDAKNDKIILEKAVPQRAWLIINQETGDFVSGTYLGKYGDRLNTIPVDEIAKLNREHKNAIPRLCSLSQSPNDGMSGHSYMVVKLNRQIDIDDFWGFSVIPGDTLQTTELVWKSRALNNRYDPTINDDMFVPEKIQTLITNHISDWVSPKQASKDQGLILRKKIFGSME